MRSACKYKRSKNANGKNGNIAPKVSFFKVLISGSYPGNSQQHWQ